MQQRLERALSVVFDCDLRKNLENPDFPSIISGLIDLLEEDNFQLIRFSTIKNLFLLFTSKKVLAEKSVLIQKNGIRKGKFDFLQELL